jgi:hypothetical protein
MAPPEGNRIRTNAYTAEARKTDIPALITLLRGKTT